MNSRFNYILCPGLFFVLFSGAGIAEPVFDVSVNGPSANRVDILYLGDGYTASEMTKYEADVQAAAAHYTGIQPYTDYTNYFNVRRVNVVSNESGADHPENNQYKDTALDATYNCFSIQRLICVNTTKVYQIVNNSVLADEADIIIVMVNDAEYGGSGGAVAVASTHQSAGDLVIHEVGHSFGLLADEYDYGTCNTTVEPGALNVTMETNRNSIKWNQSGGPPDGWIEPSTALPTNDTVNAQPGLYVGANYCTQNVYRPTYNSMMRQLGREFEQINEELLVRRIYAFVSPLESYMPVNSNVSLSGNSQQAFNVSTLNTVSGTVSTEWFLDSVSVGTGTEYMLDASTVGGGVHNLRAVVTDTTAKVRFDPNQLLKASHEWTVDIVATPGPATLVSPQGQTAAATPMYVWDAVSNSTWYQLKVDDDTGNPVLKWYTAAQANCSSGQGSCSVQPGAAISGNATWSIRTYNSFGNGPWSAGLSFSVEAGVPAAATLVSPSGSATGNPSYTWNPVTGATWYYLWVNDSTGTNIRKWYTAAAAGCGAAEVSCSVTGPGAVNGNVTWWIQTWNSSGTGPWSSSLTFTVSGGVPGQPALIGPAGAGSGSTPTYSWSEVTGATWYQLWVNDATGTPVQQWYQVGSASISCNSGTCSVAPDTGVVGNATWWVRGWNSFGNGAWSVSMSFSP